MTVKFPLKYRAGLSSFVLFAFVALNAIAQSGQLVINEFSAINDAFLTDEDGDFSDWIEIRNQDAVSVNLSGWSLTDETANKSKWIFPDMDLQAGGFLVVFASGKDRVVTGSELHTNFKLNGSGEYLGLFDPEGIPTTEFNPAYPSQMPDISYGLFKGEYVFFSDPTPGSDNGGSSGITIPPPEFSHSRGFYSSPFNLVLSTGITGSQIYYTLDGVEPSPETGILYNSPIAVSTTSVIRAVIQVPGRPAGLSTTHTYLFPEEIIHQSNNPDGYPALWGPYTAISGTAIADYEMDPELMADEEFAASVQEALQELPTISLVTNREFLFSHDVDSVTGGIYIYTGPPLDRETDGLGAGWERPVSFEYFDPSGETSLQVNCGVRIQGGHSRRPEKSPKHSFRLVFKSEYGPERFDFPFFGEDAVSSFNTLTLRAGFNNTWIHSGFDQRLRYQGIRDAWAKDTQRAMGHPSSHSTYAHLYINGIYWGIYQPNERMDRTFAAAYMEGNEMDFDVIKDYQQVVDGNSDAWFEMMDLASKGLASNEQYQKIQGKNKTGEYDLSIVAMVDVENLIDYMLINFYGANTDWDHHNWAAMRNRVDPGKGYSFLCWDAEHIIEGVSDNMLNEENENCPSYVFQKLRENEAFKRLFADQVAKHCFSGGVLTPESATARWIARRDMVEKSIVAESARWGDYRRDVHPTGGPYDLYRKDPHWLEQQSFLLNNYFPGRTSIFVNQLKSAGLFPKTNPPEFRINGDITGSQPVDPGDELSMHAPEGVIYFTTNGTDPVTWTDNGPDLSEGASMYTTPLVLANSGIYNARVFLGGEWSAINSKSFIIDIDYHDIKITEIHYHPAGEDTIDGKAYEFLELKNTGITTLDIGGARITDGVDYTFPGNTRFSPGEFLVLASDRARFFERYGFAPFDKFGGQLDNNGERIILLSPAGDTLCAIRYNDASGWPPEADGSGNSLVPVDLNPVNDQNSPADWRASWYAGGSPGRDDTENGGVPVEEIRINPVFSLAQNYPNPFSDITYIRYELPDDADIELSIFNLVGQQVATLVSEHQRAGTYLVEWDAAGTGQPVPEGGIYFYRMIVTGKDHRSVLTKKMILVR